MPELKKWILERKKNKPICYMGHVIAGYPSFEENEMIIDILVENGFDIIEIQMPFSEPSADGPLFSSANQEALNSGVTVEKYFRFAEKITKKHAIPFIFMGYFNIPFQMGAEKFSHLMKKNGLKGAIIPDLPIEHAQDYLNQFKENQLSFIPVISEVTSEERIKLISSKTDSLIYLTARKGVTGETTQFTDSFQDYLNKCRQIHSGPTGVGFGISDKKQIEYLIHKTDVAIIGSAILKNWLSGKEESLKKFLINLKP